MDNNLEYNNNIENTIENSPIIETPKIKEEVIPSIKTEVLDKNIDQKIEEIINNNQVKEDVKPSSDTTAVKSSYVDEEKSHMKETDLELEKKIEKILDDDLSKIYESLSEVEKKKFEQEKYEVSIKIIVAIKSAAGNIKKSIKTIFKIIYTWISSLKNIKNRAFIEKITKLKVEQVLRTQEDNTNK